jgi:hypothetical protein
VRDLVEPFTPRAVPHPEGTEVVGEDLQLASDLSDPGVELLRRVDHGRTDEDAVGGDERRVRMVGLLRRGALHVVGHVHVA